MNKGILCGLIGFVFALWTLFGWLIFRWIFFFNGWQISVADNVFRHP
jgi:hypothetical protein